MMYRSTALVVFLLLAALMPLQAQTAGSGGAHDSAVGAAKGSPAPAQENLNLDDSGTLITPAAKPASPAPGSAAVPAAPAAPVTAIPPAPATTPPASSVPATAPSTPVQPAAATPAAGATVTPAPPAPAAVTPSGTTPAAATPQAVKDSGKKAVDEDLLLEGGEEDLLDQSKVAQKKASEAKLKALLPDTTHGKQPGVGTVPTGAADLSKGPATIPTPGSLNVPATPGAPVAELPVPVTIEKTHSINFARNLKEYRSPKLAMLMSLILPGSGEVYAQSNIWAAGFVIAEAAIITGGASLASSATKKTNSAHSYANTHYSDSAEVHYMDSLHAYLKATNGGEDSLFTSIFDSADLATYQSILKSGNKTNYYYGTLINGGQSSPFIRGWDDVTPGTFTSQGWQLNSTESQIYGTRPTNAAADSAYLLDLKKDSSTILYGQSDHQQVYNGMIQSALNLSNYSRDVFLTLIINHVVSAITAGLLAKQHNDELLGQETFWNHVGVQISYVNTGSQTVPDYAFQVKF
jgi:hypothetical protein